MGEPKVHFKDIPVYVTEEARGMQLDAYLIALEGWRRGLTLKFYGPNGEGFPLKLYDRIREGKLFSLQDKSNKYYFYRSRGELVANKAVEICQNKTLTKEYLTNFNVPAPQGETVSLNSSKSEIVKKANSVGYPLVLKPESGSMGRGVRVNLENESVFIDNLTDLIEDSSYQGKKFLIEKFYDGPEYRVYVVGDKVIGATNRIPANVIGDGKSSIKELISEKNELRSKMPYLSYKPIKIDKNVERFIAQQGLTPSSIIEKNKKVFLRSNSNLSTGGDPIDATDILTDEVKKIAARAIQAIPNLHHAGVDVLVDRNNPNKATIIEINPTAEIGFHLFPIEGKGRDVPKAIIDYYFPESKKFQRSSYYFDYQNLISQVNNMSASEIQVKNVPEGKVSTLKYTIQGNLYRVGYISYIKRQAIKNNIHGYIKHLNKETVELVISSPNLNKLNNFIKYIKQGSKKSTVKNISKEHYDKLVKIGFHVIR